MAKGIANLVLSFIPGDVPDMGDRRVVVFRGVMEHGEGKLVRGKDTQDGLEERPIGAVGNVCFKTCVGTLRLGRNVNGPITITLNAIDGVAERAEFIMVNLGHGEKLANTRFLAFNMH